MKIVKIYISLILLFSFFIVDAQTKYDKKLEKADEAYELGQYESARAEIEKIKKSSTKKLGAKNDFLPIAYIKEAMYDVALGIMGNIESSISKALTLSIELNGQDSEVHALLLKEATEVMIQYGHYVTAQKYLDRARPLLDGTDMDEDLAAGLDVLQAQIYVGRGFYRDAIQLINDKMPYYQRRALNEEGRKKIVRERKRELARMMIFKGNAYRKMGDYLSSDSAFVYANTWIQKNLSKADILYSENQFWNTYLLEQNGLEIGAVVNLYEKAYTHTVRKYAPSHYVTVMIQERLIKSYMKNGGGGKQRTQEELFRKTIKSSYGKNSMNSLMLQTLEYDVLMGGKDVGLEREVDKMLNNSASLIPKYHPKRIEMLEFANKIALINGRNDNSKIYLERILNIKEVLYGKESPEYNLSRVHMANYYVDYTENFDEALEIYQTSWDEIVKKEITEGHLDYVDILDHQAIFYEENDQYDKAAEILDVALEASRRKYDDQDPEYALELDKIANLQYKIGQYEEAEKNIDIALEILEKAETEFAESYYAQSLITHATLLAIKGEYDEAEENIIKSERMQNRGVRTVETSGIEIEDELAEVFLDIGRYREAEKLINYDLKKKVKRFGQDSRHLNDPLVLKSRVKMILGDYTEAEELAQRANSITTKIFGTESSKVTSSLMALAKVNTLVGDYETAIDVLEKVVDIRETQFGRDHIDVARAVSELALVKFYNNEPVAEVEDLFLRAEKIVGKKLGASNPSYATILKNLAVLYIADGRYSFAVSFLDQAGAIWSQKIGVRNNINAATINVLKGDIHYNKKEYSKADNYYEDAKKLYQRFFNSSHPEYVKVQSKLSKTYFMSGDIKRSQLALEDVLSNYSNFIKDYFPALSEREKAKFWNTIKSDFEFYNTLVINYNRKNDEMIGNLYNNALLTKALLLSSSIKIRQRILSSGDEELTSIYQDWEAKKDLLTKVLSMSSDQLVQAGIDGEALLVQVEDLEKQLSEKSEDFSSGFEKKIVTWNDVKNSLKPNEVALEMIRFRVFDHTFSTDSVMYAVLYVKNEGKRSAPGLILLKNGKDLETKYLKYYRNSIRYRVDDPKSYEQFWKPIQDVVGNPGKIYLSADGVYNQINLEAIKLEDETYVLDRSNIILVSNTKDLYFDKVTTKLTQQANTATMFGDPKYYMDTSPGEWTGRASMRGGNPDVIGRLYGTAEEVEGLKNMLRKDGWITDEYQREDASEQAVKDMDNPKIFHVATHGFFQPDANLSTEDLALNENAAAQNPLLKTGLLMSGAGDILNETTSNFNIDDGILTAYEAMNLNLDKTDLVVLSACETGLGEIEAGEGVYGLQRAFLVAGARTIIMSLFKVSDEATQKLMVKFYTKWLETGDKRSSFILAKQEIKEEYVDPIFWGPFIMIGLD